MVTILLEIISLGIMIILGLVMLFSKAFLERITLVNSFVLASALGIYAYLCNRHINAFFDFQIHQAICLVIGLAAFFLFYFIQTTRVGFWIFAVIFSIVWAFATAFVIQMFISQVDMVWFWVIFGPSFIINIGSHIRSRNETVFIFG